MTQPQEHEPTPQETELYEAMTAGDWGTVEQMRQAAYEADPTPPTTKDGEPLEGWLPPIEQFDVDYDHAYSHYQADHEMPEREREIATKIEVADQNQTAMAEEAAGL